MGPFNLLNQRYGRLVVVERAETDKDVFWLCECSCGNTCKVSTARLRAGRVKSCGCLRDDVNKQNAEAAASKRWGDSDTQFVTGDATLVAAIVEAKPKAWLGIVSALDSLDLAFLRMGTTFEDDVVDEQS
jgi:hypothetical protein